ncbi:RidA family protein [Kineosporia babensis]|uniref:RidA family protein n=1 Tax=Kineosporia babensis TaxID=499548 RepID=A0A9X1STB1_9ACTN|nr:Rid family hydrolase [Kineosporia babensis]MCD5311141.1 RidA family protein [Kineosporia babensis]
MSVLLTTPPGMWTPVPYHHVSIGTGSRTVQIAGQVARDTDGNAVATGDLAGQVAQVLRNTKIGLEGVGAAFADVTRMRFFVADWQPEKMGDFMAGIESVAAEIGLPSPLPPTSLIGVQSLYEPDVMVELETEAVLD